MNPYQELANAIIILAVKDYRRTKNPAERKELERFFRSEWFSLYYRVVVFSVPLQGHVLHCKGCCGSVWFSYRKTVQERLQP